MQLAVLLLAVLAAASCETMDVKWRWWKQLHSKDYKDESEEGLRRMVWGQNYHRIKEHNAGNHSFTLALNEFADMTQEEFHQLYLAPPREAKDMPVSGFLHKPQEGVKYASSMDWRSEGAVTSVKNQGQCGSCWAFSATGALEAQYKRSSGSLVSLSEQQLVDCSWKYGNAGCNGGLMDYAFKYVKNSGLCSESDYPYLGYVWRCKGSYCSAVTSCSGYKDISSGSEDSLLDAVASVGPVSVAIDASTYQFQFYSSGVYYDQKCSSNNLNHGVLVVGYDSSNNQEYWIVKNSWGTSWGASGYISMAKNNNNMCGIASAASYPTM